MADTVVNKSMPVIGDAKEFVLDHVGPASYVQVVVATNTGDKPKLPPGLSKGAYVVIGGVSDDGLNAVYAIPPASSGLPTANNWLLKWVTISSGSEVTGAVNLGARHVRLLIRIIG